MPYADGRDVTCRSMPLPLFFMACPLNKFIYVFLYPDLKKMSIEKSREFNVDSASYVG
jgi:hypothetical protein